MFCHCRPFFVFFFHYHFNIRFINSFLFCFFFFVFFFCSLLYQNSTTTSQPNQITTSKSHSCGWPENWSVIQIQNLLLCQHFYHQKSKWTRNGNCKSKKIYKKPKKPLYQKRMKTCKQQHVLFWPIMSLMRAYWLRIWLK